MIKKTSILILSCLLLFTLLFSVSLQTVAAENLRAEAREAYLAGEYSEAEELWLEVLAQDKEEEQDIWETNYFLGLTYNALGKYEEAEEYLSQAWEIDDNYNTAVNYSRALYQSGDLDQAQEILAEKATYPELDHQYFNLLGLIALEQEDYQTAEENFVLATEENPDSHFAWNNLGLTFIYQQNYQAAVENLEKAVELEPEVDFIYNNYGLALENLEEYQEALQAYEKAFEINPDNTRTQENISRIENIIAEEE